MGKTGTWPRDHATIKRQQSVHHRQRVYTRSWCGRMDRFGVSAMSVVNVTEQVTRQILYEAYVQPGRLACACLLCQEDILAIALNHLPPRYVSRHTGELYAKAEYFNLQLESDVLQQLARAAQAVAAHPRHEKPS
ncbi:hypothetical protein D2Q93_07025 [Alicyclobacillaceae bacterium I2511]|nr:hypothetical protein D2Q93_07025 [Alicyclobacillaceae bacterium I2511]